MAQLVCLIWSLRFLAIPSAAVARVADEALLESLDSTHLLSLHRDLSCLARTSIIRTLQGLPKAPPWVPLKVPMSWQRVAEDSESKDPHQDNTNHNMSSGQSCLCQAR